jgi:hypothetical protein
LPILGLVAILIISETLFLEGFVLKKRGLQKKGQQEQEWNQFFNIEIIYCVLSTKED